ncbi:MAG: glycosyltransferase [Phycisphaeraceae bacterium]|jgi:GT2 family glycosyltransferase|nr:glycosyltransferase [Phycisphaeraceae bacterium]
MSIVIPVHDRVEAFRKSVRSVSVAARPGDQIIVVADGPRRKLGLRLARRLGATVIHSARQIGPAGARNLGAQHATGDAVMFIDADVVVPDHAIQTVADALEADPDLHAVFGCYDLSPSEPNFLSQYKNLFHHFIHQQGCEQASTFWTGCGTIRRHVFNQLGGFDMRYSKPAIEDIELGYRLRRAGYGVRLMKDLQVTHLKRWGMRCLMISDVVYRAVPWTELILRERRFINDLNLRTTSRLSVVAVAVMLACFATVWLWPASLIVALVMCVLLLIVNMPVYSFFGKHRGWTFAAMTVPWHWLYYLYCGIGFGWGSLRYAFNWHGVAKHMPVVTPLAPLASEALVSDTAAKSSAIGVLSASRT